mmetsp:Transcript_31389/g.35861  ORF Transcript_31389/g.35861 Transcript_31389/m.35861 type:complete len:218 (-) Transcript_31389:68-721(-)
MPICEDDESDTEVRMQPKAGNQNNEQDICEKKHEPANNQLEDQQDPSHEAVAQQDADEIMQEEKPLFKTGYTALRVSVYNYTPKKVNIAILLKCEDDAPNFFVPLHPLTAEVYPNKAKTLAYFHKIHPERPFGEYSFSYNFDGEPADVAREDAKPAEDQGVQGGPDSGATADIKVWPAQDDAFEGIQDEINCDQCTLFNPISNYKCEVCGATLPHRK